MPRPTNTEFLVHMIETNSPLMPLFILGALSDMAERVLAAGEPAEFEALYPAIVSPDAWREQARIVHDALHQRCFGGD